MKIIFLAYRKWSIKVYPKIKNHSKISESILCTSQNQLDKLDVDQFDLLVSCGWRDELGEDILKKIDAIGVHCAEKDRYS